jgi:hypothetical protein
MAHMDMADAMSDGGGGMRSGMCAVGPASMADAPTREAGRRVVLVVDAAAAGRAAQLTVVVAGAARAGLAAAWVVPGRPRTACAGDDLMITHAGAVDVSARLELASRDSVTVLARTASGRLLAGPVRIGPGAPPVVLRWGVVGRVPGARVDALGGGHGRGAQVAAFSAARTRTRSAASSSGDGASGRAAASTSSVRAANAKWGGHAAHVARCASTSRCLGAARPPSR